MKLNNNTKKSIISDNLKEKDISVNEKSMKKIVSIISQYMYTDSSSAFREYWLNARESVDFYTKSIGENGKDQGQSYCQPTEIQLPYLYENIHQAFYDEKSPEGVAEYDFIINPNKEERRFYIRDYATGLTEEELETIIASAGETTKNDSNEYGGGLGIGTLSGFKVSDTIIFTAYKDGKQSQILLSSHNNKLVKMPTIDTLEPNGVRVEFDILDDNKLEEFTNGALKFLEKAPIDERALIIYKNDYCLNNHKDNATQRYGNDISRIERIDEKDYIDLSINGCYYKGIYNDNVMKKVVNSIFYSYFEKMPKSFHNYVYDDKILDNFAIFIINNFMWNVPVGYLQGISPTRESFTLNEKELTEYCIKIRDKHEKELEEIKEYCELSYEYIGKGQEKELEYKFYNSSYNKMFPKKESFTDSFELWIRRERIIRKAKAYNKKAPISYYFSLCIPRINGDKYKLFDKKMEMEVSQNYFKLNDLSQKSYITIVHNSKEYDVTVEIKFSAYNNVKMSLQLADTVNRKHLISSNKNSTIGEWKKKIENILNVNDYSTILNEEQCRELEKVDDVNNIVFSNSSIYNMVKILKNMNIDARIFDEDNAIDGVLIRKAYTKLFKGKKTVSGNNVEYSIIRRKDDDNDYVISSIEDYSDKLKECSHVFVYDVNTQDFSSDTVYKKNNAYQVFNILINVLYKDESVALIRTMRNTQKFSKLYDRLENNGISYKSIKEIPENDEVFKECLKHYPSLEHVVKFVSIHNYLIENNYAVNTTDQEVDTINTALEVYEKLEKEGVYYSDTFVNIKKDLISHITALNSVPFEINDFMKNMCRKPQIKNYVFDNYNSREYLEEILKITAIRRSSYFKFVNDFNLSLEDEKKVFTIAVENIEY